MRVWLALVWLVLITQIHASEITLKTAAQQSFPKFISQTQDGHTEISGFCMEIMTAIQQADPEITFTGIEILEPLARIINRLKLHKIDAFVGLSQSPERDLIYHFSIPLYELHNVMAVRKNDPVQINSFEDILTQKPDNGIITLHGSNSMQTLKKLQLPISGRASSVSQGLLMLTKKRGRFFYYHDLGIINTIKEDDLNTQLKILPVHLQTFQQHIAYSKKVPKEVIEKVDTAIREIRANGVMQEILNRYLSY